MKITAARLYHPAPWGWIYSYRVFVVILRMLELEFKALRYLFIQAPLLIVWTRLPGLKNRRAPFGRLAEALAPVRQRPSLLVGQGQLGSNLLLTKNALQVDQLLTAVREHSKPPSRFSSLVGCLLRGYLSELGPAFIKFGQILSMREEVPPSIRRELQLLQDKLPPMSYKEVKQIIERELDRPIEEVFEWVEEKPIAAASLSQVHRARLRREQEIVALKIQRPYLEGIIALDTVIICDIVVGLIRLALPLFRKNTDVRVFTSSYRKSLNREMDFVLESRTQLDWIRRMENHPIYRQVYKIARPYLEYTTSKLITMEFVEGCYRFDRLLDDLTPEEIWQVINVRLEGLPEEVPLQLAYVHGAMAAEAMAQWDSAHGDLHLGNFYLVKPKSERDHWKIFLCDFGMMIESPREESDWLGQMLAAIMYYRSGDVMVEAFERSGTLSGVGEARVEEMRMLANVCVKNYAVVVEEGREAVLHANWQRSTPTNVMGAVMYRYAQLGAKWSDWWWLVLKNLDYAINIGTTLSSTFDWSEPILIPARCWVRKEVLQRLEGKDIISLHNSLDEILAPLRDYDRRQVLNCLMTGEEVRPLRKSYVHGQDIRFGMKHLDTGKAPVRDTTMSTPAPSQMAPPPICEEVPTVLQGGK